MPSPFPGMDPYLEARDIWPDFHQSIAGNIRAALNRSLPNPYYASVEFRSEMGIIIGEGIPRPITPDVLVLRKPNEITEPIATNLSGPRTTVTEAVQLIIHAEPMRHSFVEIRDADRNHELVTLIEIVSPSNKGPGPDRQAYLRKQSEVLSSEVNLIELDLLRAGERLLPYPELEAALEQLGGDYVVLLNRASSREWPQTAYEIFSIRLEDILPCIPVPLRIGEEDIPLDLQVVFNRTYDEGPYLRRIDYSQPPRPRLTEAQAAWADELLRKAGLRP